MNAAKPKSTNDPGHVYLIDGSGVLFRAFFAQIRSRDRMQRSDGTPTNAVFVFTKMLLKLVDDTDADHIAVVFDTKRQTFRNDIYPEYKANRDAPPEELVPQFPLVREATRAFNIACVELEGYEADDLIATYAKQAAERGAEVTIVSSDKDLMQLINDKVSMMDPMKASLIGREQVIEKFGVAPEKVVDVQALAGDSTDNVPGVRGIGVKTAAQLINEYGDLDTLLERAEEIKQPKRRESLINEADMARVSRELVRLKDDVPVEVPLDEFAIRKPDAEPVFKFLREMEFKSLVTSVANRYGLDVPPEGEEPQVKLDIAAAHEDTQQSGGSADTAPVADAGPKEKTYTLVRTADELAQWIERIYQAGSVTMDTETTSTDSMRAALVGVSLSVVPGEACYIPLAHRKPETQGALDFDGDGDADGGGAGLLADQIPLDEAIAILKPMLEDPSILKIGQNIKYDMQVLARYGVAVGPVDDTMLLSYVLDGGLHGHGMDALAEIHLGLDTIKFKDVAGSGKSQVTFDLVPLDKALDYAAEDADITGRLHRLLKPRLVRERMTTVYETLERPLIDILEGMERAGIKVDAKALRSLSNDFEKRMAGLETEIHKLAGHEFNVGSPKQLGEILFDEMGLSGGKKGKTGAYATGADVLEGLAAEGHDLPARVLDWRQLSKLKSTYTDALMQQINPDTGRVHTSYSQSGAATGRLSSSDPNLQNIPIRSEEGRKIRTAFIAEDGCKLLSADYSQIELRLLAHVAGIESLIEAFEAGEDIHAMTASQVFGVPIEGMDPMVRRNAKAINFGIIYGISAFGLARQLSIPQGEAKAYIDAYFERYPGIKDYMENTKQFAREHGYVETLFGRRCHTPEIENKLPNHRAFAERAAINAPIQGGAADIIKRAMIRLPAALEDAGLKAKMLLQVHDELIFEVPEKELDKTRDVVVRIMQSAATLKVPLVVDAGVGDTWAEAH
ncbi:MAG: DNA polymerase I [Rhodospirillales bacterium]